MKVKMKIMKQKVQQAELVEDLSGLSDTDAVSEEIVKKPKMDPIRAVEKSDLKDALILVITLLVKCVANPYTNHPDLETEDESDDEVQKPQVKFILDLYNLHDLAICLKLDMEEDKFYEWLQKEIDRLCITAQYLNATMIRKQRQFLTKYLREERRNKKPL